MKKLILIAIILLSVSCGLFYVFVLNNSVSVGSGEAEGFGGKIFVKLSLQDGKILKIDAEGPDETIGIGSIAIERLPALMQKNNTVHVDAVSGATYSSKGLLNAALIALKNAGGNPEDYKKFTGSNSEKVPDGEFYTDVAIIGAGGAGMISAITAADLGKNVILIEKNSAPGGNSIRSTGGMNATHTNFQDKNNFNEIKGVEKILKVADEKYNDNKIISDLALKVREQYNLWEKSDRTKYFDSPELMELDTIIGGHGINNYSLVKTLCENSKDAIEWLRTLNINLISVGAFGGASVKRIHRPLNSEGKILPVGAYIVPLLVKLCAERKNIKLITSTTAKNLITNNSGRVTGVQAEGASGNKIIIHAKSVIIASGGFGANLKMITEYNKNLENFMTTNAPGINGDGIIMAQKIGAGLVDMDQIQTHPTVYYENGTMITEGLRGDGAILINSEGKRFIDETEARDIVSAAVISQPGSFSWLIIDEKMYEASSVIKNYISRGFAVKGENYDDLANKINVPAEEFNKTLSNWNEYTINEHDPEFGRVIFSEALNNFPIYAIKVVPGIHHTMGGLKINEMAQVLREDGSIIPGLYAAGEVTGGIHGANRLGGNGVADFIIFGRIAGQNATK